MSEPRFTSPSTSSRTAGLEDRDILVVEPQAFMLRLMREFLSDIDARGLTGAATVEDALLKLHDRPFALIVADMRLPDLDGIDLARQVRRGFRDVRRRTPMLLTMAMATAGRIGEARDAGVNEILLKPFNLQGLARKVAAAMNGQRPFIETATYIGPERRHVAVRNYRGPFRRSGDIITAKTFV